MTTQLEYVDRLSQRLETSRNTMEKMDRYYGGTQPLAYLSDEVKGAAPNLFNVAINWPRLVVGSIEERLDIEGFRTSPETPGDAELWRIWQNNNLDAASPLAHTEAFIHGRSYVIVWAGKDPETPRITVESAKQVYVAHDPGSGKRIAAIKRFVDTEGHARATLYLPNRIVRYRSASHVPAVDYDEYFYDPHVASPPGGWNKLESIPNPLGIVPVVPLVNAPRLTNPEGESELADVVPLADAINKLATDLMVSAEFHAQPRRWATGFEIPMIDEKDADGKLTGEKIPDPQVFSQVKGRTWLAEGPETKFGQFDEATLNGFLDSIRTFTHAIASIKGLPPHYLALTATDNPASADAIRSSEASLITKVRRKARAFGEAWEDVMRLAVLVKTGSYPEDLVGMETLWADPETRTVAQAADAAVKLVTAGIIPPEQAQEDLGYSATQIERMRKMRAPRRREETAE